VKSELFFKVRELSRNFNFGQGIFVIYPKGSEKWFLVRRMSGKSQGILFFMMSVNLD
jgi:hypothetical protein